MKAKEYFIFTKRERSGIISLIILVLIVVVIPQFFNKRRPVAEQIPVTQIRDTFKAKNIAAQKRFEPPRHVRKKTEPLEINSADTTAFIALPGIGSKLAARIVTFREKLGGFYSVDQVGETFGLPDSTFQKIKEYLKLENTSLKRININTATVDELKVHPYIKWSVANPIVAYRNEHGAFSKLEDIKNVAAITDEVYKKISPYLIVQ